MRSMTRAASACSICGYAAEAPTTRSSVLRHGGRPERDVAFLGGIDLCHGRRDDASHAGDPQPQAMADVYGPRPPWHDIQLAITGPAVGDVESVFRERWENPQALSAARCAGWQTGSDTTTPQPGGCHHNTPTPSRPGLTRYSCYARIRAGWAGTRSHLRANEAWPAATPKPSAKRAA
jgi:phosphatidylserine/phosphatidylglycerophosphate/cardiolipin synthase-like enzyme